MVIYIYIYTAFYINNTIDLSIFYTIAIRNIHTESNLVCKLKYMSAFVDISTIDMRISGKIPNKIIFTLQTFNMELKDTFHRP